jgi:hypothetical protein
MILFSMLISAGEDYLELRPVSQTPQGVPGVGDTCFIIRVRCGSFSAETRAYIEADDIKTFAEGLRKLDELRHGAVVVESMSPGELRLEIRTTDRAGHLAALGQVGAWCFAGIAGPHWNVIGYCIPFCPSLLSQMAREFQALAETGAAIT